MKDFEPTPAQPLDDHACPLALRLRSRYGSMLAFGLLVLVYVTSLALQKTPLFEDDVLFFFRYADNLATGNGYRFNAGEPPVCGASAPLWPLLLAFGERLGLTIDQSARTCSWCLSLATALLLGWLIHQRFGAIGVLALAPILAINHFHSTWATSGMESPLTYLLFASALAVASGHGTWRAAGVVGGLCLAHKVDLIPLGAALLAGNFLWRREQALRALLLAGCIAGAWYGFATAYFGSPLPNSFYTKLSSSYGDLPRSWFAGLAFFHAGGLLRACLAVVGVFALRRQAFAVAVTLTQVLVPTLAYTLHPPAERFSWYVAAITPATAFLAASGMALVLRARKGPPVSARHVALTLLVLVALGAFLTHKEYPYVRSWHLYLESYQRPMMEAGQWVDANTPADARVITGWGMPAYYSRRHVYDHTFLNRRPEEGDLFKKYEPEVWIYLDFRRVEDFEPLPPYRIVHLHEAREPTPPFFVAVLMRESKRKASPRENLLAQLQESLRDGTTSPSLERHADLVRERLAALPALQRRAVLNKWPGLAALAPPEVRGVEE